jgi:hypothetical protein
MTSLRCLRLMPFLLCAAMAAAGCAADGSASGELPGSIGNGKTDGLGVEDGSELQTAALTLINFASRRTLVTEVGLAEGAAAAVEAARPVATLASLETNAAVGTPAAEGLVEFAAAHLDTGGLPPCVAGTIAGTSESVLATGAWEACNIEVASPVVVPEGKSLVIYPGAAVRLDAVRAATGETSSITLRRNANLAIIGGKAQPVIFASGTGIEIVGGAAGSRIRVRHALFPGDLYAGQLLEDSVVIVEEEDPSEGEDADGGVDGGDGIETEPVPAPAPATVDIEFSYIGALRTAGELTPLTLGNGEAFRETQQVNIRQSVIEWVGFDSTSFSGIKCDAPAGESVIGPVINLDHALVSDNVSSVQLSARDSVFQGATMVFGALTGNHIIGDITGAAWGDLIVKVVAQNNAWSDWSDTETANATASTYQACGSDASEVDAATVLTEIPMGVGPDVDVLSAPVITVAGLVAGEDI